MKKIFFISWLFLLQSFCAVCQCKTYDCAIQAAEAQLKIGKYRKALTNLDDADNFVANDIVKKEKIKSLRNRIFDAVEKEKEDAKKAKELAELATKKAEKALADLKAANAKNILLILKEADANIYILKYDEALEKCKVALALGMEGAERDSIKHRLLEIAFWYTETDTLQAAVFALKLLNINVRIQVVFMLKRFFAFLIRLKLRGIAKIIKFLSRWFLFGNGTLMSLLK